MLCEPNNPLVVPLGMNSIYFRTRQKLKKKLKMKKAARRYCTMYILLYFTKYIYYIGVRHESMAKLTLSIKFTHLR